MEPFRGHLRPISRLPITWANFTNGLSGMSFYSTDSSLSGEVCFAPVYHDCAYGIYLDSGSGGGIYVTDRTLRVSSFIGFHKTSFFQMYFDQNGMFSIVRDFELIYRSVQAVPQHLFPLFPQRT